MIRTKEELKSYFETGDVPTEGNFSDLIDTFVTLEEVTEIINEMGGDIIMKKKYYNFLGEVPVDLLKCSSRMRSFVFAEDKFKLLILPYTGNEVNSFAVEVPISQIFYKDGRWMDGFTLFNANTEEISNFEISKEEFEGLLEVVNPEGWDNEAIFNRFKNAFLKNPNRDSVMLPVYVGYSSLKTAYGPSGFIYDFTKAFIDYEPNYNYNGVVKEAIIFSHVSGDAGGFETMGLFSDGTMVWINSGVLQFPAYFSNTVEGAYYPSGATSEEQRVIFNNGEIEVALDVNYSGSESKGNARITINAPVEGLNPAATEMIKTSRPYTIDGDILTIQGVLQGIVGATGTERKDIHFKITSGKSMYMLNEYVIDPNNPNRYVIGTQYSAVLTGTDRIL